MIAVIFVVVVGLKGLTGQDDSAGGPNSQLEGPFSDNRRWVGLYTLEIYMIPQFLAIPKALIQLPISNKMSTILKVYPYNKIQRKNITLFSKMCFPLI